MGTLIHRRLLLRHFFHVIYLFSCVERGVRAVSVKRLPPTDKGRKKAQTQNPIPCENSFLEASQLARNPNPSTQSTFTFVYERTCTMSNSNYYKKSR